jgi:hypothetical protein
MRIVEAEVEKAKMLDTDYANLKKDCNISYNVTSYFFSGDEGWSECY